MVLSDLNLVDYSCSVDTAGSCWFWGCSYESVCSWMMISSVKDELSSSLFSFFFVGSLNLWLFT